MAVIDRHRVARLVELSAAERTAKGPERQLREEDVRLLIRAAFDDATDAARADFKSRMEKFPTSAWPWSAVQATAPRSGGGIDSLGLAFVVPKPAMTPALLVLIRGQADSADIDPGNRLPDRGTPEAAAWETLHKALDTWDTPKITRAIGPQGWVSMIGGGSGHVPKDTDSEPTSGAPPGGKSPGMPAGGGAPAPQPPAEMPTISFKHPAVIAAGAAVIVAGGVVVYALNRRRKDHRPAGALHEDEVQP